MFARLLSIGCFFLTSAVFVLGGDRMSPFKGKGEIRGNHVQPIEATPPADSDPPTLRFSGVGIIYETEDEVLVFSPGDFVRSKSMGIRRELDHHTGAGKQAESADQALIDVIGWLDIQYDLATRTWAIEALDFESGVQLTAEIVRPVAPGLREEIEQLHFVEKFFEFMASEPPDEEPSEWDGVAAAFVCPVDRKCCQAAEFCIAVCDVNEKPDCRYRSGDCRSTCIALAAK